MDPEIWRGPRSRWTQILDAFTPSAWISGLDPRIWRGSGSRWTQILEELLPSAWIASYFPHPGRAGAAGPPNRLAPRSIAKVAVLLLEIAVFQQILCSPPFGSPLPTPPGAGTWELLNEANPIPVLSRDLVLKSHESKDIGCAGSEIWWSNRMRARALGARGVGFSVQIG